MQIRKYTVMNMKEAITKVKAELGSDAVILTTRTVKGKGGRSLLEVSAAVDYDADAVGTYKPNKKVAAAAQTTTLPRPPLLEDGIAQILENLAGMDRRLNEVAAGNHLDRLSRQVDSLSQTVTDITQLLAISNNESQPIFSGDEQKLFDRLLTAGIERSMAADLIQETVVRLSKEDLQLDRHGAATLAETLMGRVPLAKIRREGRRICALVGPTGMGKTTTIAKLAAEEMLQFGRSVGFITIDTFRIGAVEQLRTYAKILDRPVEVAMDEADLVTKIEKMPDIDTVFVDTAGISPRDARMMTSLARYFSVGLDFETHLVISASTQQCDLEEMTNRFKIIPINSIIVSKIDEVSRFGGVFNYICEDRPPLSYFTTGQNVPEDIEPASKERVADMILGISSAA
jgi:flagellar biosynthesis protein FlhF